MKKLIAVGIITVLTIALPGCSWFTSEEPGAEGDEKPTVVEETPTEYVYENITSNFSLTFPINWGTAKEKLSATPVAEDVPTMTYTLTAEDDDSRYVQIYVFNAKQKDNSWILDLPATLIKETDKNVFYFSGSGDCYGGPGCEDVNFKTILDETKKISDSFKIMGEVEIVKPEITSPENGSTVEGPVVTISGKATPGYKVIAYNNPTEEVMECVNTYRLYAYGIADSDGNFEFDLVEVCNKNMEVIVSAVDPETNDSKDCIDENSVSESINFEFSGEFHGTCFM